VGEHDHTKQTHAATLRVKQSNSEARHNGSSDYYVSSVTPQTSHFHLGCARNKDDNDCGQKLRHANLDIGAKHECKLCPRQKECTHLNPHSTKSTHLCCLCKDAHCYSARTVPTRDFAAPQINGQLHEEVVPQVHNQVFTCCHVMHALQVKSQARKNTHVSYLECVCS